MAWSFEPTVLWKTRLKCFEVIHHKSEYRARHKKRNLSPTETRSRSGTVGQDMSRPVVASNSSSVLLWYAVTEAAGFGFQHSRAKTYLARYSLNYLKSVSWRIWYWDNTFTGQRLNQYPTVIDTKLRRATMWSAMSREVSYKGIANATTVFLATSAGWSAENDSRTWARYTMANLLQQFVKTMKSPESVSSSIPDLHH